MKRKSLHHLSILILLLFNTIVMNSQSTTDSIVTISSISITDNPARSYKGIYKNGKPYNEYFKVGDRDFTQIDFYKKGKRKYQYSLDFLKLMEGPQSNNIPEFDIKSTYKNDKIIDGIEYTTIKGGIVAKKWKKGVLNSFSVDVFAKHYFNRIFFDKKGDTLWVYNLKDKKSKVKSYIKNGFQIIETYMNNELISYKEAVDYTLTLFPENSQLFSFKKNATIKSYAHKKIENKNVRLREKNMNTEIISFPDISRSENMNTFFDNLSTSLSNKKGFSTLFSDNENPLILAYINTDTSGKIDSGIRWIVTKDDSGYYEIYKNGNPNKKKEITLQEFQEEAQLYFKNSRK